MKLKISLIMLFALVTGVFVFGFISYQQEIQDAVSKDIKMDPVITRPENPVEEPMEEDPSDAPVEEPMEVVVPNVVHLSMEEATENLEELNLMVELVRKKNTSFPQNVIFWQEPFDGMTLLEGDIIKIFVSDPWAAGEEEIISVPLLIGLTEEEAVERLHSLGFHVAYEYNPNWDYEDGVVYSQNYFVDARVSVGTEVTIRVAKNSDN